MYDKETHKYLQVSVVANWPAQQNGAVQSFKISPINYSGRASELGKVLST